MMRHQAEYEELLSKRDSLDSNEQRSSPPGASTSEGETEKGWLSPLQGTLRSAQASPLALWLAALLLVIACTDLFALAYVAHLFRTVYEDKDFATNLEYASPYIGLKELYASGEVNASAIDPIIVRPRVSAQVFANDPDRRAPRGEHDYWHKRYGQMSPNERRLRVNSDAHTVVQFRAIDFGMEDCRLVFTLPPLGVPLEAGADFSFEPGSKFDVFRLDAPRPLDVKTLSYRTRPRAIEKVAKSVSLAVGGDTEVYRFPCPWSSLHVFEVACAEGAHCGLDVWSSQNTTYGLNMVQHQTV